MTVRLNKERPYNAGTWTTARFNSFIKGALRSASNRWGPKFIVRKRARTERGRYLCAGYETKPHIVGASVHIKGRRVNNVLVDHINPIGGPEQSWDIVIKNMFCEEDGLQVLCKDCHDKKTKEERQLRNVKE